MHNQPSEMVLLAYPDRFFTSPGWTGIRSRATLPPSPVHASRSASDGDLPRAHRTARPPGPLRRVRAPRRRVARPAAGAARAPGRLRRGDAGGGDLPGVRARPLLRSQGAGAAPRGAAVGGALPGGGAPGGDRASGPAAGRLPGALRRVRGAGAEPVGGGAVVRGERVGDRGVLVRPLGGARRARAAAAGGDRGRGGGRGRPVAGADVRRADGLLLA